MATVNSDLFQDLYVDQPRTQVHRNRLGLVHVIRTSYVQSGAGSVADVIRVCKVPGVCRLLIGLWEIFGTSIPATADMDMGWESYEDNQGATIAADDNGIIDGLDIAANGVLDLTAATVLLREKEFDAKGEVTITATILVAALADADQLDFSIAYLL